MSRRFRTVYILPTMLTLALAMIAFVVQPALAQSPGPISGSVDRTALTTDETLTLTVVVNAPGQNVPQPQLPDLNGFSIMGNSSSSQISIVNGAISSSNSYSYRLQPYQSGSLTIEPVTLSVGGQVFQTEPITVEVSQGTGNAQAPGAGRSQQDFKAPSQLGNYEMFVEAEVDNANPYVGEQIVYTFRLYEASGSMRFPSIFGGQPSYEPPALTGFWTEGEMEQSDYRVSAGGRIYNVTEIRTNVFPTAAGEVSIDPASLTIPSSGFQRGGTLQTEPVTLNVQALPAGAPNNFGGAVGQFDIQATVDTIETAVDEPVTLNVTVFGNGNLSTAADPVWPELEGWRSFESDGALNMTVRDGVVGGQRDYERLLVPTQAGAYTIPAIEYSYFDPVAGEYRVVGSEPLVVSVAAGKAGPIGSADLSTVQAGTESAGPLVGGLKQPGAALRLFSEPLARQPWYWLLWTVPALALAGGLVLQQRRTYLHSNAAAVRSSQARKAAQKELKQARALNDSPEQLAAAYRILTGYLTAKLDRPVVGLTAPALTAILNESTVSQPLIDEVLAILSAGEFGRYSPVVNQEFAGTVLLERTQIVIDDLEQIL